MPTLTSSQQHFKAQLEIYLRQMYLEANLMNGSLEDFLMTNREAIQAVFTDLMHELLPVVSEIQSDSRE